MANAAALFQLSQLNRQLFQTGAIRATGSSRGRKEIKGEFVGFSRGDAETPFGARIDRLKMLAVTKGVEFGDNLRPALRVAQITDEKQIALEPAGIEQAEQGSDDSSVKIEAFLEGPFFKIRRRTIEPFAENRFKVANGLGFSDRHGGAFSWHDTNNLIGVPQFLSGKAHLRQRSS
jgi:hypothetical protein